LAAASLGLYFSPAFPEYKKFYLVFFRFWELAAGGAAALLLEGRLLRYKHSWIPLAALVGLMCAGPFVGAADKAWILPVVVFLSVMVVATENSANAVSSFVLRNKTAVFLGK